ncbi:MAG TPA: hypothetical protein H9856_04280 [Candidatus Limosilactobacillus merdigallinarum]|uniref:Uncharacterized protein n=1 Tax=Candidatus Limosilactobacillus merdigallinarum TaxID=2838652 RepID=A0A9D2ALB2_9LACO|nr:hypothetical protein [Candidatus Limosilactobacillus merdigallinarum]
MKSNIIYPPLVETAYNMWPNSEWLEEHCKHTKPDVYRCLVANNVMDKYGHPTQTAINCGQVILIGNPLIRQAKNIYPVLQGIPDQFFIKKQEQLYLKTYAIHEAAEHVLEDQNATAEQQELAKRLLERLDAVYREFNW